MQQRAVIFARRTKLRMYPPGSPPLLHLAGFSATNTASKSCPALSCRVEQANIVLAGAARDREWRRKKCIPSGKRRRAAVCVRRREKCDAKREKCRKRGNSMTRSTDRLTIGLLNSSVHIKTMMLFLINTVGDSSWINIGRRDHRAYIERGYWLYHDVVSVSEPGTRFHTHTHTVPRKEMHL